MGVQVLPPSSLISLPVGPTTTAVFGYAWNPGHAVPEPRRRCPRGTHVSPPLEVRATQLRQSAAFRFQPPTARPIVRSLNMTTTRFSQVLSVVVATVHFSPPSCAAEYPSAGVGVLLRVKGRPEPGIARANRDESGAGRQPRIPTGSEVSALRSSQSIPRFRPPLRCPG